MCLVGCEPSPAGVGGGGFGASVLGAGDSSAPVMQGAEPLETGRTDATALLNQARTRFASYLASASDRDFSSRTTGAGELWVRTAKQASIGLPRLANGRMVLEHAGSGLGVSITRLETTAVAGEWVDGLIVHPAAGPKGSHLFVRPTSSGSEDFYLFEQTPAESSVAFRLDLTGAGGLRSVRGSLEVLDTRGIARLRVQRPYVVDGAGAKHHAALEISDCPVDRDPRAATGRRFVGLEGQTGCTLSLSWPAGLVAPLLVDPEWQQAALLNAARTHHSSTLLPNGDVLVTGGFDQAGNGIDDAEIFCPEDNCPGGATFSVLGSTLTTARGAHTASLLPAANRVLIAGGRGTIGTTTAINSAAQYDVTTQTFTSAGTMNRARNGHTATLVGTRVLIAGGSSDATAELYDPSSGFGGTIPMTAQRRGHVAEITGNGGHVVLAGGFGSLGFALASAELFDPATSTFAASGNMTSPRAFATATRQDDPLGTVLMTGGTNGTVYYKTADVFVPNGLGGGAFQQQPVVMQKARAFHAATKLVGEATVLVTGGTDGITVFDDTEIFVLGQPSSLLASDMEAAHNFHTATALQSGRAVVIGGGLTGTPSAPESGSMLLASAIRAEILLRSNGDACNSHGECASGICYDLAAGTGVCCSDSCSDPCRSCRPEQTADPIDPGGECLIVSDGEQVLEQCQSDVELALICVGGTITASQVQPCEPYVCATTACYGSCSTDAQCDDDHYCVKPGALPGSCEPKKGEGEACASASQCDDGRCVDGVCCDSDCSGQCESCNLSGRAGVCSQVVDQAPQGSRPACEGSGTDCEGICRTSTDACTYDSKPCDTSVCVDGVRNGGRCDVANPGTCSPVVEECAPFACDSGGTLCLTVCSVTSDCGQAAVCRSDSLCAFVESAECDGDHTVVEPDGGLSDCSPFRCAGAACLDRCRIVDDCVSGKVCDQSGACVDPPDAPPEVAECGFAGRPLSSNGSIMLLALAASALASRRRHSRGAR